MMSIRYIASSRSYFAFNVGADDAIPLASLLWRPHPDAKGTWWTGSPYLAAPFWSRVDPADAETRAALGPAAWNYATSFAKTPLTGTGVDSIRVSANPDYQPKPFQVAAIQRGVMRKRILIADEPGLGKSCEALVVSNILRSRRIVIGCPTGLIYNWAKECENWLVDARSITILDNARKNVPETGVVIVPYSRGHSYSQKLLAGPRIDHLILDELHFLKDPRAQRAKPWLGPNGIAEHAEHVSAITGTPIPNNPLEIHGALQRLAPETMGEMSREKFQQTYCTTFRGVAKVATKSGGEAAVQFETNEGKHEHALNAELRASGVMVRRLKNDVLDQLPPKHVHLVHLTPTTQIEELVREEASLYEMLETRLLTTQELFAIKGHIANVRARLGALKAPKIAEYIRWIFESGEQRVVLFMLHREAMEIVRKYFEPTRIRVRIVSGDESPRQKQAQVDAFQRDGGYELLIGQVVAAGVGLTMTKARYCVLGEIAWTPGVNDQAIDRVHRITQTRQVEAPIITFPHAVEEKVIRVNAKKAISQREALDVNLQRVFAAA